MVLLKLKTSIKTQEQAIEELTLLTRGKTVIPTWVKEKDVVHKKQELILIEIMGLIGDLRLNYTKVHLIHVLNFTQVKQLSLNQKVEP